MFVSLRGRHFKARSAVELSMSDESCHAVNIQSRKANQCDVSKSSLVRIISRLVISRPKGSNSSSLET